MTRAYLGLGSNLGDRAAHLQLAIDALGETADLQVVGVSKVYETAPVGGPEQDDYLNAVVAIETDLTARELLAIVQHIEQLADRVRTVRWGPRTLDVDVLLVGDQQVDEPDLQVPHPRLAERGFVLAPLRDVAPDRVANLVAEPEAGWEGVRGSGVQLHLP